MDRIALIKALRCSATVHHEEKNCEECPYRTLEPIDKDDPLFINSDLGDKEYWESCNLDQMALDAAELLENMEDNILTQAATLLAPKMMCVKCGLGCGQYERNNMCSKKVKNWLKENINE